NFTAARDHTSLTVFERLQIYQTGPRPLFSFAFYNRSYLKCDARQLSPLSFHLAIQKFLRFITVAKTTTGEVVQLLDVQGGNMTIEYDAVVGSGAGPWYGQMIVSDLRNEDGSAVQVNQYLAMTFNAPAAISDADIYMTLAQSWVSIGVSVQSVQIDSHL